MGRWLGAGDVVVFEYFSIWVSSQNHTSTRRGVSYHNRRKTEKILEQLAFVFTFAPAGQFEGRGSSMSTRWKSTWEIQGRIWGLMVFNCWLLGCFSEIWEIQFEKFERNRRGHVGLKRNDSWLLDCFWEISRSEKSARPEKFCSYEDTSDWKETIGRQVGSTVDWTAGRRPITWQSKWEIL